MIDFLSQLKELGINLDTLVLMLASLLALSIILKWHADSTNRFNLQSAFMSDDGNRLSLSKVGQLVAMLTSTWAVIYQTRHGMLTEWLYTGYMVAWAGANALNKYLDSKKEPKQI